MTRRFVLGAAGAIAVIASANASELPAASLKEVPVPPYNWTGYYIGANGGYAWNTGGKLIENTNLSCDSYSSYSLDGNTWYGCGPYVTKHTLYPDGGFGGGQVGFNWQAGRIVYGVEVDFQGAGISDSTTLYPLSPNISGAHAESELDWFGTVRGRIGLTVLDRGQGLIYFTGGFAYGGAQTKVWDSFLGSYNQASRSETVTGYAVGAGFEYAWSPAWSVKGEWLYMDMGKTVSPNFSEWGWSGCVTNNTNAALVQSYNIARFGINYHFVPAYEPLK